MCKDTVLDISAVIAGLFLVYQPIVDSRQRLVKLEVLLRCFDDDRFINPEEIVQCAEQDESVMKQLDLRVLENLVSDYQRLKSASTSFENVAFAINVSPHSLSCDFEFFGALRVVIDYFPCMTIEVELLESIIPASVEGMVYQNLKKIRALGVNVSLDDFEGKLGCMTKMYAHSFDNIKVDGSIIQKILECVDSERRVRSLIKIAHRYNALVTAERVETIAQYQMLKKLGCDLYQGYLFSKPLGYEDLVPFLQNGQFVKQIA